MIQRTGHAWCLLGAVAQRVHGIGDRQQLYMQITTTQLQFGSQTSSAAAMLVREAKRDETKVLETGPWIV